MNNLLRYFRISVVLIGLVVILTAGGDAYLLKYQVNVSGDFIRSDELGNVFLVKDNQLTKYNAKGEKVHVYSNLLYGDITYIDTQDPFKILLYFQPFGQIQYLDHTLSLISTTIDLNRYYTGLPSLVCASYQGAFWVYDPIIFEMVRVDQSLEISERSGNLQQVTGYSLDPNYMLERDNFLYLNDPAVGILIFDKYGSYYKTIPVQGLSSFQVFNNKIIYTIDDEISIYDVKLNEMSSTTMPMKDANSISVCLSVDPQLLFMLGKESLFFYQIQ